MPHVLGVKIVDETFEEALDRLSPIMAARAAASLFFVNAHTLNLAAVDPGFRRVLNAAELVYGDGTGVRWAARWRGTRLKANLNGTDLVPALLARGRGLRCYLLGTTPGAVERAAAHFRQAYPGCVLAGFHHGYLDEGTTSGVVAAINDADVDLLLVGMGNPLQERWIARNRARLRVGLCAGVGGLFTYWAGDLDRAPAWMRRHGIEWLHILRRQPAKLGRYALGNPLFLIRLLTWLPADLQAEAPATRIAASSRPTARRFGLGKHPAAAMDFGLATIERLPESLALANQIIG
jgi:N-acetylglucosaminyldiphosphoundecaprenol N-acetyl-beta-D-mannosaminyltransferase